MQQKQSAADILALTEKVYGLAKAHIASGQQVSQEDIAILNNSRKVITKARENIRATIGSHNPRSK